MTVRLNEGTFTAKVARVFSTKVVAFTVSFGTSLMISLLLGPSGRGAYLNLIAVSGLAGALGVLGLPNAINYYSARQGSVKGLLWAGIGCTAVLSVGLIVILWLLMPWLSTNVFSSAAKTNAAQLYWMLAVIPPALLTTFATAVLIGRQQVRTYSAILISHVILTFALTAVLVLLLGFGVSGAIVATGAVLWLIAIVDVVAVLRLAGRDPGRNPASIRAIARYGLRVYPASITGYFTYRMDTYMIPVFMLGNQEALGLYGQAVTMAELLFYIPDSITTVFFSRVAGLTQDEANVSLGRVSRLTVLVTGLAALAIVPVSYVGIHLVLPKFVGSLVACYVLLPAVMALSLSKVTTSYISGRGRPGLVSVGSALALAVNVVANVILIPRFGIVGASVASLISYGVSATYMLNVASHMSGRSILSLIVPGRAEVAQLTAIAKKAAVGGRAQAGRPVPQAATPAPGEEGDSGRSS